MPQQSLSLSISESPLVSVCVSNYNYGRFLPDLIESVQQQTFADWELIITDDKSTDGSEEMVRAYASKDPRIHFIGNPCRLGMNGNLQRAAASGKGKYLKILCADDWLAPNALEVLVGIMETHAGAAILCSAAIYSNVEGRPLRVQSFYGEALTIIPGEKMLDLMVWGKRHPGGNSDYFIRASAFRAVGGYDTTLFYAADYDLVLRLCRTGQLLHTDEPLVYWRNHSASSSAVNPGKLYDVMDSFTTPAKVFQPRRIPDREWRRYQILTGRITAIYMVTVITQFLRGNGRFAVAMARALGARANLAAGSIFLPGEIVRRLYRTLTRQDLWPMAPPPSGAGSPSWLRKNALLRSEGSK